MRLVVLLDDIGDFGGAADLRDAFFFGPQNAERLAGLETFRDHLFIARLKDVQRQRSAGQEYHVERKERE